MRLEHEYYSVKEVALLLRVAESTVWRWVANGDLPVVRIGGTTRVSRDALRTVLKTETTCVTCPNCGRAITRRSPLLGQSAFRRR